MKKVIEQTEEIIKKIVSCRLLYYIVTILLFAGTYYLDLKNRLMNAKITDGNHLKYFVITTVIIGITTLLFTIFSKKIYQKVKPHIIYLVLALILGGIYIVLIPLCAQSDEPEHLYRTFQVAKGEIISPVEDGSFTTEIPKSVVDMVQVNSTEKRREHKKYYDIKEMMKIELNESETVKIHTVGNYHGTSYFPQAIGVKIGMMLKLNPYFSAMLGRITGLVIITGILALGIKKLPKHKLFATIILLSPVSLSYMASFSADGIILACTFLMVSYVLYYMKTREKIKKWDYIILAILTFIISISKMAYLPAIGILIFIPKECFEKPKRKLIFSSIFIALGLISAIWWTKTANINAIASGDTSSTNTWIFKNPLGYLIILFRTTISTGYSYLENAFAGYYLCHNQVNPYAVVPFTYIVIAIMAFFSDENEKKTTMIQKLITFGIIVVSYVLISTAMYVANTEFKNNLIIGVQGRYLLPLILMAVFFGDKKKLNIEEEKLTNIAVIANYTVYLAMMTKFFI